VRLVRASTQGWVGSVRLRNSGHTQTKRAEHAVHGEAAPGLDVVVEEFRRNLRERDELGAAFAAVVDGRVVVDIWGGVANRQTAAPWRSDTIVPVFSGTKGLVSTCLLILLERGQVQLDAPVCEYWPEFAEHDKDKILVRHIVSHQAGMPGVTTPVTVLEATDHQYMARLLADQSPITPPGMFHAYHALTMGWLCGELVRRVDGRSVGRFFAEEVAQRLRLDAWIGLPEEFEPRVARLARRPDFAAPGTGSAEDDPLGWSIWANPPRYLGDELAANMRAWHAAEVPAASGIADARSMARLYGCLARGGTLDGVGLLAPDTLVAATTRLASGRDPYMGTEVAYSAGFQIQSDDMPFGVPRDAFGYGGVGGSLHGCWPSLKTGFSYAMNLLAPVGPTDSRATAVLNALHEALTATNVAQSRR
jgi:CubicO group peptidase (beta-lactamase class C family)